MLSVNPAQLFRIHRTVTAISADLHFFFFSISQGFQTSPKEIEGAFCSGLTLAVRLMADRAELPDGRGVRSGVGAGQSLRNQNKEKKRGGIGWKSVQALTSQIRKKKSHSNF